MSTILGIDFSTHAVDAVALDAEADTALWQQARLHGRTAFERTRTVRDELPARGSYRDDGVILVAIEEPMGGQASSTIPLQRVLGAILACLPADLDVLPLPPWEWRQACGLPGSGSTERMKKNAAEFAREHWTDLPPDVGQDGLDAFCIAFAARKLCNDAADRAA